LKWYYFDYDWNEIYEQKREFKKARLELEQKELNIKLKDEEVDLKMRPFHL